MTSLFDEPVGPPGPIPPDTPPKRRHRRVKPLKIDRNGDADLDAQLINNTPDVIDPGYDAHMMRVAGKSWAEIAKRVGSPTPSSAMYMVSRYLQDAAKSQSAQHMQEALQTQIDRYEAILSAWWTLATEGHDEKAATVVLRALERLDRVLRITDGDVVVSRETLVVSANPDEYIRQLQGVVQERTKTPAGQDN